MPGTSKGLQRKRGREKDEEPEQPEEERAERKLRSAYFHLPADLVWNINRVSTIEMLMRETKRMRGGGGQSGG